MIRRKKSTTQKEIKVISYKLCPAKTYYENGKKVLGRKVFDHCTIVGLVANALIKLFPESLQKLLFPKGTELIVACHDVGKVSPTFALKLFKNTDPLWKNKHSSLKEIDGLNEYLWGGHAGVTAVALKSYGCNKAIQQIAAQHHGSMPAVEGEDSDAEFFGGKIWQQERENLIDALKKILQADFIDKEFSFEEKLVLSGLTSVADWIGSGSLFDNPQKDGKAFIGEALKNAGYISFKVHSNLSFEDIFNFSPRQIQSVLIDECKTPGVYIMEAPMGIGKTEAALYAAYKMLESKQATGIYFALPTQMTSNKLYDRFDKYLEKILHKDCIHRKALLLHSNARLKDTELGVEGEPGNSWFNSAKRGLLAPFAVGTLDQALMAVMHVKHGFVRAFGLAGKVVILDEVHTYDAYTNAILIDLVHTLNQIGCTVIILSATLSFAKRKSLLNDNANIKSDKYPLITANPKLDASLTETHIPIKELKPVHINLINSCEDETEKATEEALLRAENKQQVLWIENTVQEAQECYLNLAARCKELNVECVILHSRFTPVDRAKKENKWVDILGKNGWQERTQKGRIIIGTQVLEQSLDIDADFLISKFAPIDMLLQRLGRLWRHKDCPRPKSARCEAWIITPEFKNVTTSTGNNYFGSSAFIYSNYILCRSLETLEAHLKSHKNLITLPKNIRSLIDNTYKEREETGLLKEYKHELFNGTKYKKGINTLEQLARGALAKAGTVSSDNNTQTRYSEIATGQILLVKSINFDSQSNKTILTFKSGNIIEIPWKKSQINKNKWRQIGAELIKNIVLCPETKFPVKPSFDWLHKYGFNNALFLGGSTEDKILFTIAVVKESGNLAGYQNEIEDNYAYEYNSNIGLMFIQKE